MSPAESAKRKICALHHLSTRSQSVKSECKIHSFFAKQNPLSEALVEIRSPGLHFNCRICHVLSALCPLVSLHISSALSAGFYNASHLTRSEYLQNVYFLHLRALSFSDIPVIISLKCSSPARNLAQMFEIFSRKKTKNQNALPNSARAIHSPENRNPRCTILYRESALPAIARQYVSLPSTTSPKAIAKCFEDVTQTEVTLRL